MGTNVGILGLGVYLPPEVRRNDWWPEAHVARWMEARGAAAERHVMPDDMSVFDMEERAAHSDAPGYAFMMQLALAEAMLSAGRARCGLLVQSCAPSRLLDMTTAIAPYFGDAATAMVVGRVPEGHGIEASAHFTDSRYPQVLIASVPGATVLCWGAQGR